jgi:hypothetical protein
MILQYFFECSSLVTQGLGLAGVVLVWPVMATAPPGAMGNQIESILFETV